MRPEVPDQVGKWHEKYLSDTSLRVVEVGSMDINGSVRPHFAGHDYVGVDMRHGAGVDVVGNAHELSLLVAPADIVICLDTFEHDDAFWLTLPEIWKTLKPGGWFICGIPTIHFRTYHGFPDDFWRFTESSFFGILLAGYELIDSKGICTFPPEVDTLIAIARKPEGGE